MLGTWDNKYLYLTWWYFFKWWQMQFSLTSSYQFFAHLLDYTHSLGDFQLRFHYKEQEKPEKLLKTLCCFLLGGSQLVHPFYVMRKGSGFILLLEMTTIHPSKLRVTSAQWPLSCRYSSVRWLLAPWRTFLGFLWCTRYVPWGVPLLTASRVMWGW